MKLETLITTCTVYNLKLVFEKRISNNWLKSVSAFANSLDDCLFFGMNDGVVEGVDNEYNRKVSI